MPITQPYHGRLRAGRPPRKVKNAPGCSRWSWRRPEPLRTPSLGQFMPPNRMSPTPSGLFRSPSLLTLRATSLEHGPWSYVSTLTMSAEPVGELNKITHDLRLHCMPAYLLVSSRGIWLLATLIPFQCKLCLIAEQKIRPRPALVSSYTAEA